MTETDLSAMEARHLAMLVCPSWAEQHYLTRLDLPVLVQEVRDLQAHLRRVTEENRLLRDPWRVPFSMQNGG